MKTMVTNMAKRQHQAGGLIILTAVAALLMAVALIGCSTGGTVVPRESVTGLAVRADAVGQDNGSLTSSLPTAGEYRRMGRRSVNFSEQASAGPRVEFHAPILER